MTDGFVRGAALLSISISLGDAGMPAPQRIFKGVQSA
jgi:hypothetical protein